MDSYSYIKMFNYALEKQINCKTNYKQLEQKQVKIFVMYTAHINQVNKTI